MLHLEDFGRFLTLHARAQGGTPDSSRSAADLLGVAEGGMAAREFWHLARAIKIAAYAGEVDMAVVAVVDRLTDILRKGRLAPLTAEGPWLAAICWAIDDIARAPVVDGLDQREASVGQACSRLRARGFAVEITGLGCGVPDQVRIQLGKRLNALAANLGGVDILHQLFRILRACDRHHDGFWLFGNQVVTVGQIKSPTLPFAWLLALGLKHLGRPGTARQPAETWKELATLIIDAGACFDIERYGQAEQIDLHPADLPFVFDEVMGWARLFAHPQTPPIMPGRMHRALKALLTDEDIRALSPQFLPTLAELEAIIARSEADRPTLLDRRSATLAYPNLMAAALGRRGEVNPQLVNPFDDDAIDHFAFVLFEAPGGLVMSLPKTLAAGAAATWVVRRLWQKLDRRRAEKLVGDLFEAMVADACSEKGDRLVADHRYEHGGKKPQIDVALCRGSDLALFEVKAKSLTQAAQSGDIIKSLDDYAKSYIALLTQLARHETAVRSGTTGLWTADEVAGFDILKIAVSPLSFGPLSDRTLARPLVAALARTEFDLRMGVDRDRQPLDRLHRAVDRMIEEVRPHAEDENGELDLYEYLIGVFWLDIGELLYLLERADSVHGALRPLQRISFASRDVWSEIAWVDRSGLSRKYWRPAA